MSTNSLIAKVNEDDSVTGIYVHWDGYPEYIMPMLENYRNDVDVSELISYGDVSILEKEIGCCQFYGRDRGEDINIRQYPSIEHFKTEAREYAYGYLFQNGEWKIV